MTAQKNPLGIHTECGPLNAAGQSLHLHVWPMNADHTRRWRPVEYVGRHRREASTNPAHDAEPPHKSGETA